MSALLDRMNNGTFAGIVLLAFLALCWYAWPYRDEPAKPVVLHHATSYDQSDATAFDKLLARSIKAAELGARQVEATASIYGTGIPSQQALNEWRGVPGWKP